MINNKQKLVAHLKVFRKTLLNQGADELQLYPAFCLYYKENKERFTLPTGQVLDTACEILIEGS